MTRWTRITPALYAISRRLAAVLIKEKWDMLIVPILNEEKQIYDYAMTCYAITWHLSQNLSAGFGYFETMVNFGPDGLVFSEDDNNVIKMALFDEYWKLAEEIEVWGQNRSPEFNQHIAFIEALDKWAVRNNEKIAQCEERLTAWLNGN